MNGISQRNQKLVKAIYNRQQRLLRELNDIYIFVSKTIPILKKKTAEFSSLPENKDATLLVPSKIGSMGIAKRNPRQLSGIFRRFVESELYENLIVSMVSRFEFYLTDVLSIFLTHFKDRIKIGPAGGESEKQVSVQMVVDSETIEELREAIISSRLQSVFYAEPREYCQYFESVTHVKIPQDLFEKFFEIKAARDLIVHNSCKVNALYTRKAGNQARSKEGERLLIDQQYFEQCITNMKALSGEIEIATRNKYEG